MTNTSTTRAGENTGRLPAVTRYERPGAGSGIIGVSGPLGMVEYRRGGSGAISYHSNAPSYPGHQATPCPEHPRGSCYHSDGPDAVTLTRAWSLSSRGDAVLYGALEALYADWDAEQPSRIVAATVTPAGKPGRAAPAGHGRVRTRSSRQPELR